VAGVADSSGVSGAPASTPVPVAAPHPGPPPAAGAHDLVGALWQQVVTRLSHGARAAALKPWLERLEPRGMRDGVLELVTRSARALPLLRQTVARAIELELRAVAGTPLAVRIDVDQSLGGALRALGLALAPVPAAPPALQVRPENRLAAEAVQRLARELRPEFDQLHLEGTEGCGKSLLLETLLWQRRRRHPLERWRRERGHDFFRSYSAACLDGQRGAFRGNVVACDALLFDDLQELAGKLNCQETLLEIVHYLRARGRPVVIASRPLEGGPREFLPGLRSYLRQGLRLVLPQLSAQSRAAILGARVAGQRGMLAALALELAEATDVPLGRAVAALDVAARRAVTLGRMPTRAEVDADIREFVPRAAAAEPFDRVLDRCAQFVGVSRDALVAGTRTRSAALGRHLAVYLAFEVFKLQRATVRRWLGALSPSVEPYARQKIEALRVTDRRLDGFLREVADEIGRGQRFLFG